MSAISLKSITGITSITTPAGVDNQLTLHTNDTTQRVKVTQSGIEVVGVATFQDLDVDGHTELDNVNIVGVTTHNGQAKFYGNGGAPIIWGNTGYSGHLSFDGSNNAVIRAASGKALIFQSDHVNTRMTIGSQGNVSIEKDLDVDGHTNLDNVSIAGVTTITNSYFNLKPTGGGNAHFRILSTGTGDAGIFFDAANGDISGSDYVFIGQKNNLDFVINANVNAGNIDFQRAGTTQLRITSDGKILIAQTTSNWGTTTANSVIQLKNGVLWDYAGVQLDVGHNYYYNSSGAYKYIRGGYAARQTFHNNDGSMAFWSGGTGSADGTFTWSERLRITSGGDLLLGAHGSRIFDDSSGTNVVVDIYGGTTAGKRGILALGGRTGSDNADIGTIQFVNENNNLATAANHVQSKLVASIDVKSETTNSNASANSGSHLIFSTKAQNAAIAERLRIDSSGRVMIGSSTYIGGAALAVLGTSTTPNTYACFAMGRVGANVTNNTAIANIRLNGGTLGTGRGAEINAYADANWSDGSSHPTRLTFHTVASSSTSATERLRIDSSGRTLAYGTLGSGNLPLSGNAANAAIQIRCQSKYQGIAFGEGATHATIGRGANNAALVFTANANPANLGGGTKDVFEWWSGSAGGGGPGKYMTLDTGGHLALTTGNLEFANGSGIDFSAVPDGGRTLVSDGNKLDDYEEGVFVPTTNTNLTLQSSYDIFSYIKVGRMCTIRGLFYPNNSPSGNYAMTFSLPFAAYNYTQIAGAGGTGVMHRYISGASNGVAVYIEDGASVAKFYKNGGSGNWVPVYNTDWNNAMEIYLDFTYFTA